MKIALRASPLIVLLLEAKKLIDMFSRKTTDIVKGEG